MKKQYIQIGKMLPLFLMLGYSGIAGATELVDGSTLPQQANAPGMSIETVAGKTYSVSLAAYDAHGNVTAEAGGKLNFVAGSTVNITGNQNSRSIYVNGASSTAVFAGTINMQVSGSGSRNFHLNDRSYTQFLQGSETSITASGNNGYAFAVSEGAKTDVDGKIVVADSGNGGNIADSTKLNGGTTGFIVGWQTTGNGGTLNLKGTGHLEVNVTGDKVAAAIERNAGLTTEAGTTLIFTGTKDGQTTLWNRGGKLQTLGNVTISATGSDGQANGNAIYMADLAATNIGAEIIDIDGATNNKTIKITGDIYNYSEREGDYLDIKMNGEDSFFTGDNHLEGTGRSSAFDFAGSSKWTGNNIVNTTNANGGVTASFRDTAEFVGDNTVTNGQADMTFNNTSKWTGNNTVNGGTVSIYFDESSIWSGNNKSSGGITLVNFGSHGPSTAVWKGNNTISGGYFNAAFMQDTKIELDQNTVTDGTEEIRLYNNATLSKDGSTDFTTNTVSGGNMKINAYDQSKVYLNNNLTGGTTTLSLEDNAYGKGTNVISGTGRLEGVFMGANQYEGDTTVSESGSVHVLASNTTAWNGDNTVNGGSMVSTLFSNAKYTGNTNVTAGNNEVSVNNNATFDSDVTVSGGTNDISLKDSSTWIGNSASSSTGINNIGLDDTAKWQGTSTVSGGTTDVNMAGTSTWYVDGDSEVSSITVASGTTVDMIHDVKNAPLRQFNTLTMDTLSGNDGTFKLETDLYHAVYGSETTYGDKLVVNNATAGTTYYLQVADESLYTGTEISGDRKLLVATDLSDNLNLQLVGKALNQGGLWTVNPPTLFQEGDKWYLGYLTKQANPDTTVSLTNRKNVYSLWTRTTDTLRKRLGDLRYNDADAGVWARYLGGRLEGSDYGQHYHGFQVGLDKSNGNSTYGLAFENMEATDSYTNGYGESGTNSGLLYYTNYSHTGSYLDMVAKYGNINSKYYTNGEYPDHADHDNKGYAFSIEYGKTNKLDKGYFLEPKVQLIYGYISGDTYATDRNTTIKEDGIRSLIGRVGLVAGRKVSKDSDYYVKASWLREFKGDRSAALAAANGEHMYVNDEYGDSWFEVGIGGNVRIGRNTHVYGDIEKTFGADMQKKWQINAGARWEF